MSGDTVMPQRRWKRIESRAVESLCDLISIETVFALQDEKSDRLEERPSEKLVDGASVESEAVRTSDGALFNVVLFSPREETSKNGGKRYDPSD